MIIYDTDYIKSVMCTYAYREAHKRINQIVEKPTLVLEQLIYDDNFSGENITDALFRVLSSIPLEIEDSDKGYNYLASGILDMIHQATYAIIQVVFHFGLLTDYRHLFTEKEFESWTDRMNGLFEGFCPSICMDMEDYMQTYLLETDLEEATKEDYFWRARYTFVFTASSEIHEAETFNANFWNTLVSFTENYYKFYDDLIAEIKKRKRG